MCWRYLPHPCWLLNNSFHASDYDAISCAPSVTLILLPNLVSCVLACSKNPHQARVSLFSCSLLAATAILCPHPSVVSLSRYSPGIFFSPLGNFLQRLIALHCLCSRSSRSFSLSLFLSFSLSPEIKSAQTRPTQFVSLQPENGLSSRDRYQDTVSPAYPFSLSLDKERNGWQQSPLRDKMKRTRNGDREMEPLLGDH